MPLVCLYHLPHCWPSSDAGSCPNSKAFHKRKQEEAFRKDKVETRDEFLSRSRKTALSLPKGVVQKMIKSMKARCQRLYKARGGNIEEGVTSKKGGVGKS